MTEFETYYEEVKSRMWAAHGNEYRSYYSSSAQSESPEYGHTLATGAININDAAYNVALILCLGPSYVGVEVWRQSLERTSPALTASLGWRSIASLIEDLIEQRLAEEENS